MHRSSVHSTCDTLCLLCKRHPTEYFPIDLYGHQYSSLGKRSNFNAFQIFTCAIRICTDNKEKRNSQNSSLSGRQVKRTPKIIVSNITLYTTQMKELQRGHVPFAGRRANLHDTHISWQCPSLRSDQFCEQGSSAAHSLLQWRTAPPGKHSDRTGENRKVGGDGRLVRICTPVIRARICLLIQQILSSLVVTLCGG